MDIYTYPKSRSIRATWMAEELGLDYQCHFTDVMSAEKQVPGKNQKVPALSDSGLVIFESSAICIYLAQTYGNGRFYPQDPKTGHRKSVACLYYFGAGRSALDHTETRRGSAGSYAAAGGN